MANFDGTRQRGLRPPDQLARNPRDKRNYPLSWREKLRQRYREGQEDQLGALGLVAVVLWNTRYTDVALTALRERGYPVLEADAARLSPLGNAHLNVHGRYSFAPPAGHDLRPLRDPAEPAEADS